MNKGILIRDWALHNDWHKILLPCFSKFEWSETPDYYINNWFADYIICELFNKAQRGYFIADYEVPMNNDTIDNEDYIKYSFYDTKTKETYKVFASRFPFTKERKERLRKNCEADYIVWVCSFDIFKPDETIDIEDIELENVATGVVTNYKMSVDEVNKAIRHICYYKEDNRL